MIKFLDLAYQNNLALKQESFKGLLEDFVSDAEYIGGKYLTTFEHEFANYCEVNFCAGTSNGLDALKLCLLAYGVGAGDRVIVPANTFIATWLAVSQVGAELVPIDCDATGLINLDLLDKVDLRKVKVIVGVSLYGNGERANHIRDFADRSGLIYIEDAAQAHGARVNGSSLATIADAACYSFYPGKNLGALGDGGAVVSNDRQIIEKVKCLGNYGTTAKYDHQIIGFNARLDPLQAAFLKSKLEFLDSWNLIRAKQAKFYLENIHSIKFPKANLGSSHVWHLFTCHPKIP